MNSIKAKEIDQSYWLDFMLHHNSSTFFHTPLWNNVWAKFYGGTPKAFLFNLRYNQVVLPGLENIRLFGLKKNYVSSPMGTYGGFIGNLNPPEYEKIDMNKLTKKYSHVSITTYPFSIIPAYNNLTSNTDHTYLLHLEKGLDYLFNGFSSNHKRNIKTAESHNFIFRQAESDNDWHNYFLLYKRSMIRWGNKLRTKYTIELFQIIRNLPGKYFKLWLLCDAHKNPISGCIIFYFNRYAVFWHGAGDERYFKFGISAYIHYKILEDAINRSYLVYDFNPSGGLAGVEKFKKGFNPETKIIYKYTK